MASFIDTLITIGVLFAFFLIIYSKITHKGLGEIYEEIKNIITGIGTKTKEKTERLGEVRPRIKF